MTINCCNGRVGKRMMDLAVKDDKYRELVAPTGIEIIKVIGDLGGDLSSALNCCNGRVGRRSLDVKEIASKLSGADN